MHRIWNVSWRVLVVAAGYVLASIIAGWLLGGRPGWLGAGIGLLAGILIGVTLGPIAARLPESRLRHLVIWGSALFLNILSVSIEGAFFVSARSPMTASPLAWTAGLLLDSLVTAGLITWLFAPKTPLAPPPQARERAWYSWAWRFVLSAFGYLVFYFIFGAVNYALVTRPYYETHVSGLVVPAAQTVLMAEVVRAPLIVLSIVPLILAWKSKRLLVAVLCGIILFVIGGVVPLVLNPALPDLLRLASAIEIFFQNFLTGVVAVVLLGFAPASAATAGRK